MTNTEHLFEEAIAKISTVIDRTKYIGDALDYLKEIRDTIVSEMNATKKIMWRNSHMIEKMEVLVEKAYKEAFRWPSENSNSAWEVSWAKNQIDKIYKDHEATPSAKKIEQLTGLVRRAYSTGFKDDSIEAELEKILNS